MLVPKNSYVMIVDGAHRFLYRNVGEALAPTLELVDEESQTVPCTAELGSDRPGRHFESGSASRGGYEETDLHQQAEDRFAQDAAEHLAALAALGVEVVLVAAPHVLGVMRARLGSAGRAALRAEIAKDYAPLGPREIAQMLVRYEH